MADIEITYPKESKKEMRVLSREEQKQFMKYLLTDMELKRSNMNKLALIGY